MSSRGLAGFRAGSNDLPKSVVEKLLGLSTVAESRILKSLLKSDLIKKHQPVIIDNC